MAKLTLKQKAFCDYYIESGNATEAAIRAGYSKRTAKVIGSENLTKPYLKSYIDERLKQIEDKRIAKPEEVLKHLTAAMRGEIQEDVVIVEGDGDGCSSARIIKKGICAKDRIKAAELLGKRYGLYKEDIKIDANVNTTKKLDSILNELGEDDE